MQLFPGDKSLPEHSLPLFRRGILTVFHRQWHIVVRNIFRHAWKTAMDKYSQYTKKV